MRKIFLFMMVTLNGYFEGANHDISWHNVDEEFNHFAVDQLHEIDTLIFGRKTYELMASYWPTKEARQDDAAVTELMNTLPKLLISHTQQKIDWDNTKLLTDNAALELQALRQKPGKDIAVFGSSNLCVSLLEWGLLDELRIMVNPVVLDGGVPLFDGLKKPVNLKLSKERTFDSGNVLLTYEVGTHK